MLVKSAAYSYGQSSYTVAFNSIELVATMSALVHFVDYVQASRDGIELDLVNADQQTIDRAKYFVVIAETMILRLQDALDEEQINLVSSGNVLTLAKADAPKQVFRT